MEILKRLEAIQKKVDQVSEHWQSGGGFTVEVYKDGKLWQTFDNMWLANNGIKNTLDPDQHKWTFKKIPLKKAKETESTQGSHPPLIEQDDESDLDSGGKFSNKLSNEHLERFVDGLLTILGELELEGQLPQIETPQQARDALLAVVRQLYIKKSLVAKMSRKFARFGAKRFLRKQKTVIGKAASSSE